MVLQFYFLDCEIFYLRQQKTLKEMKLLICYIHELRAITKQTQRTFLSHSTKHSVEKFETFSLNKIRDKEIICSTENRIILVSVITNLCLVSL